MGFHETDLRASTTVRVASFISASISHFVRFGRVSSPLLLSGYF